MIEIVGVKFNGNGKVYYFDPNGLSLESGMTVLVETSGSVEMGKVSSGNHSVPEETIVAPLKPVIRIAKEEDFVRAEENKQKEKEAFQIAMEKIIEHKLDMKLVEAEYTFDRSKILFYFTADGRVDFRELVKSLASIFRTRIELRQIGVRDEARQLGSIGICGRFLCCSTFLKDFHPVSIKMAKEQGLSLNPTKISGVCGRLMCCLQYEQNAYDDMLRRMPCRGDKVETPDGIGTVVDTATLKGRIKVKFVDEKGEMTRIGEYVIDEFNPLDKGKPIRLEKPAEDSDSEYFPEEKEYGETAEIVSEDPKNESDVAKGKLKKRGKREKTNSGNKHGGKEFSPKQTPELEAKEDGGTDLSKDKRGHNRRQGDRRRRRRNRRKDGTRNTSKENAQKPKIDNASVTGSGGYSGGYDI